MEPKDRLIAYLEGQLNIEEQQQVERALAEDTTLRAELESLKQVLGLIDTAPQVDPSAGLKARFNTFLEEELAQQYQVPKVKVRRWYEWGAAAAIALLILGTGMGVLWQNNRQQQAQINTLVEEVQQTRKLLILSMLEQSSASERIKAMNTVQPQETDPQIIDALIQRLELDDNVNVQVKAAEALANFSKEKRVIAALIKNLSNQQQPELQITLIDILTEVGAKGAYDVFEEMTEKEDVMEVVKVKAAEGMGKLI